MTIPSGGAALRGHSAHDHVLRRHVQLFAQIRQRLLVGRRAGGHGRGEPDPEAQLSGGADAVDRLADMEVLLVKGQR